ncbi:hypothetical protein L873DRAFT_1788624 [Choiromyces venosus 120613-1]|uniref:Uncharacterized protein n=1 Tax=Choiromyces venosus 120613-1 TaxID=1336337 RepID=A0A3N4JV00_9PEZI|nr:hypothetical protein L873DRAFT_1788624 [Choiromyces venosus 120613-1]
MIRGGNANSMNSSRKNVDDEWTTIPVKPKLLVSFPKNPTEPTLHMLVLESYFIRGTNRWIWHCYLDDEGLSPNPRNGERKARIKKAFVKSGNFFAERGIVLHSLNISTPRIVELFFGSEEDLWKADALVGEYSTAMTGVDDHIRRKEYIGKMVCHGVYFLEQFAGEFVGRWDLKEERLRELEELNPVFDSHGKRVLYRIRLVHYMSSRTSNEQLMRTGATWAVTFSDFRVAECFIDGLAEFNFFWDPCSGGLKWYQDCPSRLFQNNSFRRSPGSSNGGGSVSGALESSNATTTETADGTNKSIENQLEGLRLTENPELAKSTLNTGVSTIEQKKHESQIPASILQQTKSTADIEATSTTTATTDGAKQIVAIKTTDVQILTAAATSSSGGGSVEQAILVVGKSEVQAPTNTTAAQATSAGTVRVNTTNQQKPLPFHYFAETTTTSTPAKPAATNIKNGWKAKHNSQPPGDNGNQLQPPLPLGGALLPPPPPAYRKPPTIVFSGILPDNLNKFPPLGSSAEDMKASLTDNVKCQYPFDPKRHGAKVTPPAKAPTGGSNGNNGNTTAAPAAALAGQTNTATTAVSTTKQPHRPYRQSNLRQSNSNNKPSDNTSTAVAIATTSTTTATATTGVSVGKGEVTTTSVETSQLKPEKVLTEEEEKLRQAKLKKRRDKKKAGKKAAALRAATGNAGGGNEVKVEKKQVA